MGRIADELVKLVEDRLRNLPDTEYIEVLDEVTETLTDSRNAKAEELRWEAEDKADGK